MSAKFFSICSCCAYKIILISVWFTQCVPVGYQIFSISDISSSVKSINSDFMEKLPLSSPILNYKIIDQSEGTEYLPSVGLISIILFSRIPWVPYFELKLFGCLYRYKLTFSAFFISTVSFPLIFESALKTILQNEAASSYHQLLPVTLVELIILCSTTD